jgi:hypothetical protein
VSVPVDAPQPAVAPAAAAAAPPTAQPAAAPPPAATGDEVYALTGEAAWLRQQNVTLQQQLAQLQHHHQSLMQQQHPYAAARPIVPAAPHGPPTWSEQTNPANGQVYYWNASTGESTYTRPADHNPV